MLYFKADAVHTGTQGLMSSADQGVSLYLSGRRVVARFESVRQGTVTLESSELVVPGQWHSVGFNFGTNGAKLYVDGILRRLFDC